MHPRHKNMYIGAASGLVYLLIFRVIGHVTGFAYNFGALFLIPLSGLSTLINVNLYAAVDHLTGMSQWPLHDWSFADVIQSLVYLVISLAGEVLIGAVIGWYLPASTPKKIFWQCLLIQLVINFIVGIPLIFIAGVYL